MGEGRTTGMFYGARSVGEQLLARALRHSLATASPLAVVVLLTGVRATVVLAILRSASERG